MPKIICNGAKNKGFFGADAVFITGMQIGGKKMARYIDADALITSIKNELWDWNTLDDIKATSVLRQTITDIQNMPDADVVEVVRCKDCKHYWKNWKNAEPENEDDLGICLASPKDDAFCSEGERREE